MSPSRAELAAAALDGDQEAWRQLVVDHSRLVWSIIHTLAISEPDASDVFQSVFLKLTEHLGRIQPEAMGGWLVTVTRHECYDVSRRRRRLPLPSDDIQVAEPDSDAPLERVVLSEEEAAVVAGLERLSQRCQRLLRLLADTAELSYDQISEVLDMPKGSIGPTRARCLEQLARTPELASIGGLTMLEGRDG